MTSGMILDTASGIFQDTFEDCIAQPDLRYFPCNGSLGQDRFFNSRKVWHGPGRLHSRKLLHESG